ALLSASPTREEISVTFLALLELLHMGTIELAQNDIFGEITISMNINAKAGRGA
ncbi:MAG: segregation/condensation protein A, partial [Christensenellaceae bacterium]